MILASCVGLWNVFGPVDLKAWNYQKRLVADSLPSHLRVVRFRFPFVVRAERSVRFYTEWRSWLDVLVCQKCPAC